MANPFRAARNWLMKTEPVVRADDEPVPVVEFVSSMEAERVRRVLEEAGIKANVLTAFSPVTATSSLNSAASVVVRASDLDEAQRLIA